VVQPACKLPVPRGLACAPQMEGRQYVKQALPAYDPDHIRGQPRCVLFSRPLADRGTRYLTRIFARRSPALTAWHSAIVACPTPRSCLATPPARASAGTPGARRGSRPPGTAPRRIGLLLCCCVAARSQGRPSADLYKRMTWTVRTGLKGAARGVGYPTDRQFHYHFTAPPGAVGGC